MNRLMLAVALSCALPFSPLAALPAHAQTAAAAAVSVPAVLAHYASLVHANYEDALNAARSLQQAVQAFTDQPSEARLADARKAWLAAREFYGQTEAFRFYGGPIDDENGPEGRLNAWPMDESYRRRRRRAGRDAGLVNDRKLRRSRRRPCRRRTSAAARRTSPPAGTRSSSCCGARTSTTTARATAASRTSSTASAPNADRRRHYLKRRHRVAGRRPAARWSKAWAPGSKSNYRARFEKGGNESVRKIFVGLGSLSRGELAGERLEVALASQDQEDEHSCFSDNTHRDAVNNALGIENVWLGRYARAPTAASCKGHRCARWSRPRDAALAERTTQQIAASVAAAEAIQRTVRPRDHRRRGRARPPAGAADRSTASSQQSKDLVEPPPAQSASPG